MNLVLKHGETVGVVGPTGAGKTTLIRLLLRFAEPGSGTISWAERTLPEWKLETLRSSMALVDQHITLFPTTIMENIRYGRPDAEDIEVFDAAQLAEIGEFVEELPNSWDTMVGEGDTDSPVVSDKESPLQEPFSRMPPYFFLMRPPLLLIMKPRPLYNGRLTKFPTTGRL